MMRFQSMIVTGLAALVVSPSLASKQEEIKALEGALKNIEVSLEVLNKIRSENPPDLPALILASTEPPLLSDAASDERREWLRRQVSLLHMQVDLMESNRPQSLTSSVPGHDPQQSGLAREPAQAVVAEQPRPLTPSVGMSAAMRSRMQQLTQPVRVEIGTETPAPSVEAPAPTPKRVPFKRVAVDPSGYSANPILQAEACYRAGRYEDGVALLDGRASHEAGLLRARGLIRLDRHDEAIEILNRIIAEDADSYVAKSAQRQLEFVSWKKEFTEKIPRVTDRRPVQ